MNQPRLSLTSLALLAAATAASALCAGKPSACAPFNVIVTIQDGIYNDPTTLADVSPRIKSDGLGPYRTGADGTEAVIHGCEGGTGDMTLKMGASKKNAPARSFTVDFRDIVYLYPVAPSWVNSTMVITGQLTVGKIGLFGYDSQGDYYFTTGLGAAGFPNVNYYLRMASEVNADNPCDTSQVHVHHIPAHVGVNPETWQVWSDGGTVSACSGVSPLPTNPVYVAGIVDSRANWSSVGQARLPFSITIQRQ
jgi:hypothetical protein